MMVRKVLGSLAVAGSLAITSGCVVSGEAHVRAPVAVVAVETDPPPPQEEVVVARPGFVWVQGHYYWGGGRWVWAGGHYERERAGYVWAPGRYEVRGGHRVWVEGEWRAGPARPAAVEVRDHRSEPAPGVEVRDHRH
jgi:hypothetical protein